MNSIDEQLFQYPAKDFEQHLQIPNNERLIFSGRFGMGKTTFLKWFFENEKSKEYYNVIHLFPVNYSVASNEDIFKYIKYDIIVELLRNDYEVSETDVQLNDVFKSFFKKNYEKIAASVICMIPLLGKQVIDSYEKIRPLITAFEKIKDDAIANAKEGDKLIKFLEELEGKEGNIFEEDFITQLIEGILKRAKNTDGENSKENVLIIDDLDRIDPEHIFRLLNVFAAHFDRLNKASHNKFAFDKIIFVCDIDNIKEIFKTKYGLHVDFNGYIDKFYSHNVFPFDAANNYFKFINNKFGEIYSVDDFGKKNRLFWRANHFLKNIFSIFINHRLIDLRNMLKWESMLFKLRLEYTINSSYTISFNSNECILPIQILMCTKGSLAGLLDALNYLRHKNLFIDNTLRLKMCGELLLLIRLIDIKDKTDITLYHKLDNTQVEFNYSTINEILGLRNTFYSEASRTNFYLKDSHFIDLAIEAVHFMSANDMLN